MTATDEVRLMLNEAGVKWKNETAFMQGQEHLMTTWKSTDGKTVAYSEFEYPHMKKLRIYDCTPTQAIAATVGRGTCQMECAGRPTERTLDVMGVYFCSKCGSPIYNDCMPSYCIYCGAEVTL